MPQSLSHRLPSESPPLTVVPEEARPFLGALLNAPGSGVALLDRELKPLWVNAQLASLVGLDARFHVGRPLTEVWPCLAAPLSPLLAQALSDEDVAEAPVVCVPPSAGETRHLRVGITRAVYGGVLAGLVVWVRDETERVREEQRLREREEHMRSLADVACDGHFLHENGVILEANRATAQLLGMASPKELIGRNLAEWLAPESLAAAHSAMSRRVEAPYEVIIIREDGQRVPLEVLGRTVMWEGRPVRLAALWDISSRKDAEERAARMEHFREQLLGVMGADLRKPLHAIQLGTGALQRLDGLEPPQRQLVAHLAQAARRMERMIHELLDFTRARLGGGLMMRPEPCVLGMLVERVVEERRLAHPSRPVKLESEGDLRGVWDGLRLVQLTDTLLGTVLHQSTGELPVTVRMTGAVGGVTLSVHSHGLTLPAEEHATLFEPFRRGRESSPEGLGLGLFIARQIALAHGGRLTVESCAPGGVRFIVWLPREAALR